MSTRRPLANQAHFLPIPDLRKVIPTAGFTRKQILKLSSGKLLVSDPTYLADVYHSNSDPLARKLRKEAVIVTGFGGDVRSPIWWKDPFLVLPTSFHYAHDYEHRPADYSVEDDDLATQDAEYLRPPPGSHELATRVCCDSGSFAFLEITARTKLPTQQQLSSLVQRGSAALIEVPPGTYRFFLEQFDPLPDQPRNLHFTRNIVAQRM
jgi:hypothetical protein